MAKIICAIHGSNRAVLISKDIREIVYDDIFFPIDEFQFMAVGGKEVNIGHLTTPAYRSQHFNTTTNACTWDELIEASKMEDAIEDTTIICIGCLRNYFIKHFCEGNIYVKNIFEQL